MIAISPVVESQSADPPPRNGSLRRIDAILVDVLAGYGLADPEAGNEDVRWAAPAAQPDPLMAEFIPLPAEVGAFCAPASQ